MTRHPQRRRTRARDARRRCGYARDRIFDRYDNGEIDRSTYDRQLERVRVDKADRFEKLRDADTIEDAKYLVTAERVLELAKNARSLWERRSDEEKRDLLVKLVCNPRLDGRTVRYDLQKHFAALAQMRGEGGWRPYVDEFRTAVMDLAAA